MAGEYHSLKKQQYLNLIKECAHSGSEILVSLHQFLAARVEASYHAGNCAE